MRYKCHQVIAAGFVLATAALAADHDHGDLPPAVEALHKLHVAHLSHNAAMRAVEKAGGLQALRQANLQADLGAFFQPGTDVVEQSEIVTTLNRLRLDEAIAPLRSLAQNNQQVAGLRIQAVRAIAQIHPKSRFPQEWIARAVEEEFLTFNSAEQEVFLSLLPLLTVEQTINQAEAVAAKTQEAINELKTQGAGAIPAIGILGHAHSTAERLVLEAKLARHLDTIEAEKLPAVLVEAFIEDFSDGIRRDRIVQTAARRDAREAVIAIARQKLEAGEQNPTLLLLIDEMGGTLSNLELNRLEQAFPSPPPCG